MQLFIVIFSSISILLSQDLFFSEYLEGSNYNKAIEIYNGTGSAVDLSPYTIKQSHNGSGWGINGDGGSGNDGMHYELNLSGYTLEYGDVFIIADDRAAAEIKYFADLILSYGAGDGSKIQAFTGDDAMGLFKNGTLIDVIGTEDGPSSNAWSVAGISNATEKHTLVRKLSVITGKTDWASSAGTNSDDSEWEVYDIDTFDYFGYHGDEDIVITACMDKTAVNYNSNATMACDNCCEYPPEVSIYDIQYTLDSGTPIEEDEVVCYPSPYGITHEQQYVKTTGTITAVLHNDFRFYLQDFNSTNYAGIYVYNANDDDLQEMEGFGPVLGDNITISGKVDEHNGQTVLKDILLYQINSSGSSITPAIISNIDLANGCTEEGEKLEGMLVQINNIEITGIDSWGDWYAQDDSGAEYIIDDYIIDENDETWPTPQNGEEMTSITGIVQNYKNEYSIQPRNNNDIVRSFWADAGDDQAVMPGSEVIIDGSQSGISSDREIVDYFWEWMSGTGITILNDAEAVTSFIAPDILGEIELQLTVEDNNGNTVTDQLFIFVVEKKTLSEIQYSDENGSGEDDCYPSTLKNERVMVSGIVTAIKPSGYKNFYLQDSNEDEWGGIYVLDNTISPTPQVGDSLIFGAKVNEYFGLTELTDIVSHVKLNSHIAVIPTPIEVGDLGTRCPENSDEGEQYEGMLVKLTDVEIDSVKQFVTAINWFIIEDSDTVIIDNYFYSEENWPDITKGHQFSSITGVVSYSFGKYSILPRYYLDFSDTDPVFGCTDDEAINNTYNPDANVPCNSTGDWYGQNECCEYPALKINFSPSKFNILSSYPNPFNPTTTLTLHLPTSTRIIVDILNIKGQRIERIYEGFMYGGIVHNLNWDGTAFSSGIYFINLIYDKKNIIHKMTLLK